MPHKDPGARRRYMKEYLTRPEAREKHAARVLRNNAIARKRCRDWIEAYFASHPCVDCGESDPDVLEFDHVRGVKSANVSDLVNKNGTLDRVREEVALCEVRCANCHRRITRRRLRGEVIQDA